MKWVDIRNALNKIISEKLKNNLKFRQNLFNRLNIKDKFKDIFGKILNKSRKLREWEARNDIKRF